MLGRPRTWRFMLRKLLTQSEIFELKNTSKEASKMAQMFCKYLC